MKLTGYFQILLLGLLLALGLYVVSLNLGRENERRLCIQDAVLDYSAISTEVWAGYDQAVYDDSSIAGVAHQQFRVAELQLLLDSAAYTMEAQLALCY